jgi:hypothetical protein
VISVADKPRKKKECTSTYPSLNAAAFWFKRSKLKPNLTSFYSSCNFEKKWLGAK